MRSETIIPRKAVTNRLEIKARLDQPVKVPETIAEAIVRIPAKGNADSEGNVNGIPSGRRNVFGA